MAGALVTSARRLRAEAAAMAQVPEASVTVVFSPYRVCPLGAHIDHQGGPVTAMALDFGVLLAFATTASPLVRLSSHQYKGTVSFRLDKPITAASKDSHSGPGQSDEARKTGTASTAQEGNSCPDLDQEGAGMGTGVATEEGRAEGCEGEDGEFGKREEEEQGEEKAWGNYARGAAWALRQSGHVLHRGICGIVSGQHGVDCAGISSSAAVGVAYLLALSRANDVALSPADLIELDRRIENDFLGLRNGILDQSAIVLSKRSCLTLIRCRVRTHDIIPFASASGLAQRPEASHSTDPSPSGKDSERLRGAQGETQRDSERNSGPSSGQAGPSGEQAEGEVKGVGSGVPSSTATNGLPPGRTDRCPCGTCSSLPFPLPIPLPPPLSSSSGDSASGAPATHRESPFRILLAFSGIQGALVSSGSYNRRVDECREAASLLLQALHTRQSSNTPKSCDTTKYGDTTRNSGTTKKSDTPEDNASGSTEEAGQANGHNTGRTAGQSTGHPARHLISDKGLAHYPSLSDITPEQYETLKHSLPEPLQRRATHFFSECKRIQRGVGAWRAGDLTQFGRCVSESGLSSIENYECGTEALIQLREILLSTPGVLGARFSGAGFRGCCVALAWRCMAHQAAAKVAREYERCQPVLARNIHPGCAVVVCDSGDGARALAL